MKQVRSVFRGRVIILTVYRGFSRTETFIARLKAMSRTIQAASLSVGPRIDFPEWIPARETRSFLK